MQTEGGGLASKLAWRIRPTETLKLDSVKILDSKFVSFSNGSKQRVMALMRIRLGDANEGARFDYTAALRATLQQQRMRGLFDGLHRAGVPFLYVSLMAPSEKGEEDQALFEFDLVVGTWVDSKQKQTAEALQDLEQRASVLAATMSVALPGASVRRLNRGELRDFVKSLFLPSEPSLPQVGNAAVVSSLGSFDETDPSVDAASPTPRFYVPNAVESGRTGILLGKVKSDAGEFHDFRLQLDDLKRHVAILGMSVDYNEPILYRKDGKAHIWSIGKLVDSCFSDGGEGRAFPTGLECVAFNQADGTVSWSPISYVLRHRSKGKMLRIGLETGRSITVTPNHSVFALVKGAIKNVDASELRSGDFVVGPRSIPDPSSSVESVNLIDLLKSEDGVFLYNVPPAVFDRVDIRDRKTLKHDRRLPVKFAFLLKPDEAAAVTIGYKSSRPKLSPVLSVDEDFATLMGFYTAEGSVMIHSKRRHIVQFAFGPKDRNAIRDCQRILSDKFGVPVPAYANGARSVRLRFGHRILATLFADLVGRGAKNKRLPTVILNSPAAIRRAFLRAWIIGDAGVTVSRELINGVAYSLLFDDCLASVSHWRARTGTVIEGRHVSSLPAYHLGYPDAESYVSRDGPFNRAAGHELAFPTVQIPNPLSLIISKRVRRQRLTGELLGYIEVRVRKLESYSVVEKDAKRDGFYRTYSAKFFKRWGGRVYAKEELKLARKELDVLKMLASSNLSFLRVNTIEEVDPSSEYVYDVSVPEKENFLAGFGGVFCHNTGSGKSTTALTVVKQIAEMGLPVTILDWHNEYGPVISRIGGRVVSPGSDDFRINPVEPTGSTDPVEHVAMVTDIFSDIYRFSHPQAYMFRNALQKRLSESSDEEIPNLGSLVRTIEAYPLRSAYDNETKVALLRRLVPLTQGQAGRALNGPSTFGIDEILGKVLCVELGQLRDAQTRGIFTDIILKMIYEQRIQSKGDLEHITVVEEARNVAPARRPEDPPSVGERMIAELRKFGEAMIFIAQFPTQVASEMIKNSGARIIHRIAWPEDVNLLGDSLSLAPEQRGHITRLQVGEAVVSLARIPKPLLVQVKAESVLASDRRDQSFSAEE